MCEKWYEIFKYFLSNIGLRQGENLSPTLFHLLFYGLTDSMSKTYNVLLMFKEYHIYLIDNNDIEVFLKVYLLLYADDTVFVSESAFELQAALTWICLAILSKQILD